MSCRRVLIAFIIIAAALAIWSVIAFPRSPQKDIEFLAPISAMRIISSAFEHNQNIPSQYTCDGADVNPSLQISGVPQGAKSLALIVDDPDAPRGTWVHWTAWNISPDISEIAENSVPSGAEEGVTDFGKPGYGGPCPPSGAHRYFFKLYALDTALDLFSDTDKTALENAMKGHILANAELIGLYRRK